MKIQKTIIPILFGLLSTTSGLSQSRFPLSFSETDKNMAACVKKVSPSVVSIKTYTFFQKDFITRVGSGFFYDSNGLILTKRSVVQGGDSIVVTTSDGRQWQAWNVYEEPVYGLVLLRIHSGKFQSVKLGRSLHLENHTQLFIIGNSLGVFPSITMARLLHSDDPSVLHLETIIPPGNSGSPVFNYNGEVVGILAGRVLSDKLSDSVSGTIGLALPIESVRKMIDSIAENKKGWIGISVVDLESGHYGHGVKVHRIAPGGPAEEAKFCRGDTIISINNTSIQTVKDLSRYMNEISSDQEMNFIIQGTQGRLLRQIKTSPILSSEYKNIH
jgi:serine protease Do